MRFRKPEGQVPSLSECGGLDLFYSPKTRTSSSFLQRGWDEVWEDIWEGLSLQNGSLDEAI